MSFSRFQMSLQRSLSFRRYGVCRGSPPQILWIPDQVDACFVSLSLQGLFSAAGSLIFLEELLCLLVPYWPVRTWAELVGRCEEDHQGF